jgi:hypothetical protein
VPLGVALWLKGAWCTKACFEGVTWPQPPVRGDGIAEDDVGVEDVVGRCLCYCCCRLLARLLFPSRDARGPGLPIAKWVQARGYIYHMQHRIGSLVNKRY